MTKLLHSVTFNALMLLLSFVWVGFCVLSYHNFENGGQQILTEKESRLFLAIAQISIALWQAGAFVKAYAKSKSKYHD